MLACGACLLVFLGYLLHLGYTLSRFSFPPSHHPGSTLTSSTPLLLTVMILLTTHRCTCSAYDSDWTLPCYCCISSASFSLLSVVLPYRLLIRIVPRSTTTGPPHHHTSTNILTGHRYLLLHPLAQRSALSARSLLDVLGLRRRTICMCTYMLSVATHVCNILVCSLATLAENHKLAFRL